MLRKIRFAFVFFLALFYAPGTVGLAQASTTTGNLTVTMTITSSCIISAATLAFPSTPGTSLLTGQVAQSTNLTVTCTATSPYSIAMGNGANASGSQRQMLSSGSLLPYNLYLDSGHTEAWTTASSSTTCTSSNSCYLGTGNGAAQTVPVYGVVPIVTTAPAPGNYTDTVVMTVTY